MMKIFFEFLKLLKNPEGLINSNPNQISEEMFALAVKRSKKQSPSSMFSGRRCAVYECAMLHERILNILLLFCNVILKHWCCSNRCLKLLEICIEKGKGPRLGKHRNIQLIKGNLQLMMRMFLCFKDEEIIENDPRISKGNCGSRKFFSIESAIVEKN